MAYRAVLESRKAAEEGIENIREAVRLGLKMKREQEREKEGGTSEPIPSLDEP